MESIKENVNFNIDKFLKNSSGEDFENIANTFANWVCYFYAIYENKRLKENIPQFTDVNEEKIKIGDLELTLNDYISVFKNK